jgi:outer membrane protein assembly factor BamB
MKWAFISIMAMLLYIAMISCKERVTFEKVDENGVVFQKKPVWKVLTSSDGIGSVSGARGNVFIQGGLLSTFNQNSASLANYLCLQNIETGDFKWRWRDVIRPTEEISVGDYWGKSVYVKDNFLLYHAGPRNYCINIETGNTVWKKTTDYSGFPLCYGLGDEYFTFATPLDLYNQGIWEPYIYRGNIKTGKEEKMLSPNYSRQHVRELIAKQTVGIGMDLQPIVSGRDTLLIVVFNELGEKRGELIGFLGLYNLTKKTWEYDRIRIFPERPQGMDGSKLVLRGSKIYLIGDNLVTSFDWRTGKRMWVKDLPSFAEIQGIFEDKYMVLYDSMSTLYCVDADTGQEIWKLGNETLAYTSSYCADGILYYLSKGRLRARDLKTTKLLWDIPSDTDGKLDGHFWVFVTGLPGKNGEKGRIFTRTGYHTYCFEAIK